MVLPVLILLVSELLDVPLRLAEGLLCISLPPVLGIDFRLKLSDTGFHLGNGLLSTLECVLLGLVNPVCSVLHLSLKQLPVPVKPHSLTCSALSSSASLAASIMA